MVGRMQEKNALNRSVMNPSSTADGIGPGAGLRSLVRKLSRSAGLTFSLAALVLFGGTAAEGQAPLGQGTLSIAGARLTVSPESQTVPFNTPTIVETELAGFGAGGAVPPPGLRVLADFTGPEIDGVLPLETIPGEPFRIPRLVLKGEYRLDNIRLLEEDRFLSYAAPRSAGILVTQVLVTRISSRPMTLDEIQSRGIALDSDSFRAFNFTFGFAVDGEIVDYNVPVVYNPVGPGDPLRLVADSPRIGGSRGTTVEKFRPPQLAPFVLELEGSGGRDGGPIPSGGCSNPLGCTIEETVSLPGVILFPTDVSLLRQFFSVVLFAKNDAPGGDPLIIRDLTAKVILPPGLRQAETEPPTPLGVPIPVRSPGPDGELGTGDDVTFLVAQAEGQAEVVTEGVQEGTHVVEFELEGTLAGLPGGEVRRIQGRARGAVLVRDPTLGVTITHPEIVRADEEYPLLLTVANTSNAPVNLVELTLPASKLSGVQVLGSNSETIPTLLPGESEVVEFQLRSQRTGKVVAASVKNGGALDPSFEFAVGVGDAGIPLSPTSIVLPRATHELPDEIRRHALALAGLGFSLATAPPSLVNSDLPRVGRESVDEKVYWLAQAGRHVKLGEDSFDSLAVLAAEWTGARSEDWEWDELRRITQRGGKLGQAFADEWEVEAASTSEVDVFERFASTTSYLVPLQAALTTAAGASLEIVSLTSGRRLAGSGLAADRLRELPFADLYAFGDAEMALLASPEEGGYRAVLERTTSGTADLRLLVPTTAGALRVLRWTGVSLSSAGRAWVDFQAGDTSFSLNVDGNGDGVAESQLSPSQETLSPRAFDAVAAVQNAEADPSGHILEVLFSRDVDVFELNPPDPQRFRIPGKVSNGGLVQVEADVASLFETVAENPFEGLRNSRIVRVVFNNPLSPYVSHDLTVEDVTSRDGAEVVSRVLPVTTTVTQPGTLVEGTVYGPDGLPAPFAKVDLYEVDECYFCLESQCKQHRTAAVQADATGRFLFDYVRQTGCGDVFKLEARDPASGKHGRASSRVRFIGQTVQLDVLMLGRGTIRGRVTYEDGTVPTQLRVIANSPVFSEGREAHVAADGRYEVGDVPVGTVTLAASDRQGGFVFQTVEIPRAGAEVQRDLIIIRRAPDDATGDVRGHVYETDGTTPVYDAYVALYVDGDLVGIERSDADGAFDFGTVTAGQAEIEAFDGENGRRGAQVFFDVQPDQVNDVPLLLRDDRGTVEGNVYLQKADGSVEPVANAVVWVSGTPFNTTTDAAGFYRLEDVFAGQRTLLAADLERQEQTSTKVTVSAGGATTFRDLYFREDLEGSGIAGEVVDAAGNPVSGAFVHISAGNGTWYHEAFTDLSGRFVLRDLGPGTYELHAYRGSEGAVKKATIRFEGETPFVRLQFKKGTIRGTVRMTNESGQQVGVRSLITYRTTVVQEGLVSLDWEPHTIETEEDGTYEIPGVLAGRYVITASNAFHGEKTARGELVFDQEIVERNFLFQRNGTIRGIVLDHDGVTPVAGALVELKHPGFSDYDLTTGEDGTFTFELIPPVSHRFPIEVEVDQGAIFRKGRVWARLDKFGQELDVEVVLPKQGTVSGWVEDAGGLPVPGAVVTLREDSFPGRRLVANADGEGFFSFSNVFEGDVSLSAKAPSLGGLGGRTCIEVNEEGEEFFGLITLEPTAEITGLVVNPDGGGPVSSASVSLYRVNGSQSTLVERANADGDGVFSFVLLPLGEYRLWVFDPSTGRFGSRKGLYLSNHAQVLETELELEIRGAVDGHLYERGSGAGVPGATIKLTVSSLRGLTTYSSTNVDGYFEFLGIPEGTFRLSTKEPEGRRKAYGSGSLEEEGERETVDLYLEASGGVMGTVLYPEGGPSGPFPNVNVLLEQDGQVIGATLDNPFAFSGIIADRTFKVTAREVGGDHRARATAKITEEGEVITLDLRMVPIGSVSVSVADSFGNPVPGASLSLVNTGFYGTKRKTASTGPDGTATFSGIGEGNVSVYATNPVNGLKGSTGGSLSVDGETVALAIQLQDSGAVVGRVLLSDGVTPALDALVGLVKGGKTWRARADENGDFDFESIPLGSFDVFVQEDFGPGLAEAHGSLTSNGEVVDLGTLVLDDEDPFVETLLPEPNSRDLPLATAVTVTFNEPLDTSRYSSGWFSFRKLSGSSVAFGVSWSNGDRTLTLTPNSPLSSYTGYQLRVEDAVDLSGRHLFERVRTVFHTVDVVAPTVIRVSPRDGEKQVPVSGQIRITFSEPVVFASLSGAALQLTDLTTGSGVSTTFVHEPGEREVVLTPVGGLQTDRQYQVTVQGVEDGSGNVMTTPVSTTFWSLDTVPPQITGVTFPAGTSFTAGDDVPVSVTATDLHGVAEVRVSVGEWTFADGSEPWDLTALAPIVPATQAVAVTVEATDVHGNTGEQTATIDVSPLVNASPPEVTLACARDGDVVVPGEDEEIRLLAEDDLAIESYAFYVDGVLQERAPQNAAAVEQSFLWEPPDDGQPGESYLLRLEVRDFAGNVSAAEATVSVTAGRLLKGARSLFDIYDGDDLVLARGEFLVREPLSVASLTLVRGASLTVPNPEDLVLAAAGRFHVKCGAALDVSAKGYGAGTLPDVPEWVSAPSSRFGGSHGGLGAQGWSEGEPGEVFDSVYQPTLGGGAGHDGWVAGGGVVRIEARRMLLDGEIRARGEYLYGVPSGAGGSVFVRAATMEGVGEIQADGESSRVSTAGPAYYGSGGGGRVSLHVDDLAGFDPVEQVAVYGRPAVHGEWGDEPERFSGAGTVFYRQSGDTYGRLIIDPRLRTSGDEKDSPPTPLPRLGGGAVVSVAINGADLWLEASEVFRPRWLGTWVALLDGSGTELGAFEVGSVGADGRLLLRGAAGATAAAAYRGEYRFDEVRLLNGADFVSEDPLQVGHLVLGGGVAVSSPLTVTNLTLLEGSTLTPVSGDELRIIASGVVTIKEGATVQVSALGGEPGWVTGSSGGAGGSHGGGGSMGNVGTVGEVYDSVYRPTLPGAEGSGDVLKGGGVVRIEAAEIRLDGLIEARGEYFYNFSGGAGGTVLLETGVLQGTGFIDATGAAARRVVGPSGYPGGGGGGRISIRAGNLEGFDPKLQAKAWGGAAIKGESGDPPERHASPGTVFIRTATDTYGRLVLDQGVSATTGGERSSDPVILPALGEGAVAAQEIAGGDLWIEASQVFRPRWLGVWVTLLDGSGSELGHYEAVEIDAGGRLRLSVAAAAAGAETYRGEYRFDSIELLNGAGFEGEDPMDAGELTLSGAVELPPVFEVESLRLRSGSTVTPSSGAELHIVAAGTVTIESGALIDVSGLAETPPGVAGSGVRVGASHGGAGAEGWNPGAVGEVYGSVYQPRHTGSHQGTNTETKGGGVVRIDATSVVLDGQIWARGGYFYNFPGGSGGTVSMTAASLSGSGLINASGERGRSTTVNLGYPGSGGGGRVALLVDQLQGFDPETQVRVEGNTTIYGEATDPPELYSAPGTLFIRQAADTYGELQVRQPVPSPVRPVVWTELPSVGKGTVGTATADGADLWIEPEDPSKTHSIGAAGMWVRVGTPGTAADYRVLEEAQDRRGLLLEGAAGLVSPGDPYVGFYKFDRVTVAGTARLRFLDGDEVDEWSVDPSASLELLDLQGPSLTVTEPSAGTLYASGQVVRVVADASDPSGVSAVTLSFGGEISVATAEPYEWVVAAPQVASQQAEVVRVEAEDEHGNPSVVEVTVQVRPALPGELPSLSSSAASFLEGEAATTMVALELLLSSAPEDGSSVDYALVAETATEGSDFIGSSGTLTLPAGATEVLLPVTILGDAIQEGDETFRLELSNPIGVELSTASVQLTIFDDEDHCFSPNLLANGDAEEELESGEIPGWTEVAGSEWSYRTNDGVALSGASHFFAGAVGSAELAQDVDISVYAAWIDQGAQAFAFEGFLRTANQSPADTSRVVLEYRDAANQSVLGIYDSGEVASMAGWERVQDLRPAPTGTRWIRVRLLAERFSGTNNDGYFDALSLHAVDRGHAGVSSESVLEGDSGTPTVTFTVTRTCATDIAVDIDYATADGTAIAGSDYQATSGTLSFAIGEAVKTVDVTVLSDTTPEAEETFELEISTSSQEVALDPAAGVGTITDDDDPASACTTPNLLYNGGGERVDPIGRILGWTEQSGAEWEQRSHAWAPAVEGQWVIDPGDVSFAELRQDVDVSGLAPWIATGNQQFLFEGSVRSFDQSPPDRGRFIVEYRDSTNSTVLDSFDSGYVDGRSDWQLLQDVRTAPAGTSWVRIRLLADRDNGSSNDAVFDDISLRAVAVPHVFAESLDVDEDSLTAPLEVTVTLACSQDTVTVDWAPEPGTAAPADYAAVSGQLTLGPETEQQTISVPVHDDPVAEFPEVFYVAFSQPSTAVALFPGEIRLTDADVGVVGCEETDLLVNGGFDGSVSGGVPAGWSAHSGTDWTRRTTNPDPTEGTYYVYPGNVSWADLRQFVDLSAYAAEIDAGVLQLRFDGDVASHDQSPADLPRVIVTYYDEAQEIQFGRLDSGFVDATSGWLHLSDHHGVPRGTRWIRFVLQAERHNGSANNAYFDGFSLRPVILPTLTAGDASVLEGDSGTAQLSFPVTASCASDTGISASYGTVQGTATEGVDYTAASGTVSLTSGQTSTSVTVDVLGDTELEGDEAFQLQLSDPVGTFLGTATATGTITDDDTAAPLTASPFEARETQRGRHGGTAGVSPRFGSCPADGDFVVPGSQLDLPFQVHAGQAEGAPSLGVANRSVAVTLWVDGVEVETRQTRIGSEARFLWNVPSTAEAGEVFRLRLETEESSSSDELVLQIPEGPIQTGPLELDGSSAGKELVLSEGRFTALEPLRLAGLRLLSGARLVGIEGRPLEVEAGGELVVQCGARIVHNGSDREADALFVEASEPDGAADGMAGGSHGGLGAPGSEGEAGPIFDSPFSPSMAGEPGSGASGGAGGGLIILQASSLDLRGWIESRGAGRRSGSGGSGGSVWLRAERLSGPGSIDVRGGSSKACDAGELSGSGGGGRVALHVAELAGFRPPEQVLAAGGAVEGCDGEALSWAGAGTVFLSHDGDAGGELWVLQRPPADVPVGPTPLPAIGRGEIGAVEQASPDASHLWIEAADGRTFDLGLWGMTVCIGGNDFQVLDQSDDRRRLLVEDGAGKIHSGDPFQGVLRLRRITLGGGAVLQLRDLPEIGIVDADDASRLEVSP